MKIKKEVDFKLEAILCLSKELYRNNEDDELIEKFLNYGIDELIIKKLLDNYLKIKTEVIKTLPHIKEDLKVYFGSVITDDDSFISGFYLFYKQNIKNNFNQILEKYYCSIFSDLTDSEYEKLDLKQVIKIINNLDINNNSKLVLIEFFSNGELIYESIMEVVNQVADTIEKHYYIVEEDINEFYDYLIGHKNIASAINNVLTTDYLKNSYFSIQILIFAYNRMSLIENNNYCHIYLGYLLFRLQVLKKDHILEEKQLLMNLKSLSDPTRFKILKLLKEKPMYAQELAKELGLTSATLNHHICILLNDGFIGLKFQSEDRKKIYYQLKKDKLKIFISILERNLL